MIVEDCNAPIVPIEFDESLIKNEVEFSVPGKPRGKQRPRTVRRGKFTTTYTPKETVDYENLIRKQYKKKYKDIILNGPLEAKIVAIFPIPNSATKKERKKMLEDNPPHIVKPDCDNIAKICLDALNNIAFKDDSSISDLSVKKTYGIDPKVNIKIKELSTVDYRWWKEKGN